MALFEEAHVIWVIDLELAYEKLSIMPAGIGDLSCGVSGNLDRLMSGIGIDRPVYLQLYKSRIAVVHTAARVDENLITSLALSVKVDGESSHVHVRVISPNGTVTINERLVNMMAEWRFDAELWWPVNEGPQNLYTVIVELFENVRTAATAETDAALR